MTLALCEASCRRGSRLALDGVSLALQAGELLGVLGANGAGKTTLLGCLAGELPLHGGQALLDGRPLAQWRPHELARRVAVLPQTPSLGFDLDVDAVVGMGAYPFPELAPAEVAERAAQALRQADAGHLAGRRYLALSGGEQQRVQFARVLVQVLAAVRQPGRRSLLLDEPTASLDPRHQWELMQAAARLAHEAGVAVLVVMHDVNLAARWCDRLLLMTDGAAVASGSPAEVLTAAHLERVYGLPAHVGPHPLAAGRPLVLFGG